MSQWVQSKYSKDATKFEASDDNTFQWKLRHGQEGYKEHWVPKSEYILCDPPEVWEDVTNTCYSADRERTVFHTEGTKLVLATEEGYRLRKVQIVLLGSDRWAFIVEKKKS